MRISAKADYAVRAALELAAADGPMKGERIAEAWDIPLSFLENILIELRHAGIVRSQRGREGGYWLAKDAADVSIVHQALRERLPDGLLPWCRGCRSHHVRPGLWRALGPFGVTEMSAKAQWWLADRRLAGLWRSREQGERLDVTVEWLGEPADAAQGAEIVARLCGCTAVRLAA